MVPDITVIFKLDTRQLTLTYRKVPMAGWGELKAGPGFTPKTLIEALGDWDLDAVGAVIWLERKQRERKLRWHEVHQSLMSDDAPEFELIDVLIEGKSTSGETYDTPEPDEDPTTGSS